MNFFATYHLVMTRNSSRHTTKWTWKVYFMRNFYTIVVINKITLVCQKNEVQMAM